MLVSVGVDIVEGLLVSVVCEVVVTVVVGLLTGMETNDFKSNTCPLWMSCRFISYMETYGTSNS